MYCFSVVQFLQPTYPGMLRQIARNVFNIVRLKVDNRSGVFFNTFVAHQVFVLDPASEDGKELVEYVKLFLDHMVPARLGLLLVLRDNSGVGVALCRGFSYLLVHESPRRAFTWLYEVVVVKEHSPCGLVDDHCYFRFKVHHIWTV